MSELKRFLQNRFVIGTVSAAIFLIIIAIITVFLSLNGKPDSLYRFESIDGETFRDTDVIRGWAGFDRDSYLMGDIARYRIRLLWDSSKVNPDIETFKNGISFFPFTRQGMFEQQEVLENGLNEYTLDVMLQAVDVEPASSYELGPPTVYFTRPAEDSGEYHAYRIDAPTIHIGEYYPPDVSGIRMLDMKGEINEPVGIRTVILSGTGIIIFALALGLLWNFGRVRQKNALSEPERLWREFQVLKKDEMETREFLEKSELIFTDLLIARINMSPVVFWSGKEPTEADWKQTVGEARQIFYRAYLREEPGRETVTAITGLLDDLFSRLVEEERLENEQVSGLKERLLRQPVLLTVSGSLVVLSIIVIIGSFQTRLLSPSDVMEYNRTMQYLDGDESVERKYEEISGLVERVDDRRIQGAALYNAGVYATTPELTGIDSNQQLALLEVMFQEQRVYLDALLHSLGMEDPFLLVAIIRDSVRFMNQGEAALKAAVRLLPLDDSVHRNLELIHKRREAYAETVQELLQEGEESEGMGELQRQTLMDLEQFMQMEMPEEFAELEEGKDDKDYFILEGF